MLLQYEHRVFQLGSRPLVLGDSRANNREVVLFVGLNIKKDFNPTLVYPPSSLNLNAKGIHFFIYLPF